MKIGVVLLVGLAACAALEPRTVPTARVGSAEEAAKAASREGAFQDPRAARHLYMAEAQISRARELIRQGEYDEADSLLTRAQADAEVAVALSREAHERAEAEAARLRAARRTSQR